MNGSGSTLWSPLWMKSISVSPEATFKALQPGELFLFTLHAPRNYIAGGSFFAKFLTLPVNLAWEAFSPLSDGGETADWKIPPRINRAA
jgi:hypothetical protein